MKINKFYSINQICKNCSNNQGFITLQQTINSICKSCLSKKIPCSHCKEKDYIEDMIFYSGYHAICWDCFAQTHYDFINQTDFRGDF